MYRRYLVRPVSVLWSVWHCGRKWGVHADRQKGRAKSMLASQKKRSAAAMDSGLWFGLKNDHAVWAGFVGLVVFYLACLSICLVFMKKEGMLSKNGLYELYFANMFDLKKELQPVIGHVPTIWCILIRHVIPHLLLILFINLARADNAAGESLFGHYEGYATWPYQVLGILTAAFAFFLFLIGVAAPKTMAWLDLPDEKKLWKSGKSIKKVDIVEDEEEDGGKADKFDSEEGAKEEDEAMMVAQ